MFGIISSQTIFRKVKCENCFLYCIHAQALHAYILQINIYFYNYSYGWTSDAISKINNLFINASELPTMILNSK